jgi:hypothetical protein
MTAMLRLDPPIFLKTEKGEGLCHVLLNYGAETDLHWVTFLETGQVWACPNHAVRAVRNWSFDRRKPENPWKPEKKTKKRRKAKKAKGNKS